MVIVYRAMKDSFEELTSEEIEEILAQYPDFENIADYAVDAVAYLIKAGLVNGKSGNIAPTDYTTRAEVAVLVKRIIDHKK